MAAPFLTYSKRLTWRWKPGEILAIMGPSGSGKSTLLFILGLLLKPSRGSYYLLGEDVLQFDRSRQSAYRRQCLGFVFQSCDLIESSTVYENLEFPLIYAGVERKRRPELIAAALERVNLSPSHLSSHQSSFRWRAATGGSSPGLGQSSSGLSWRTNPPDTWIGRTVNWSWSISRNLWRGEKMPW